MEMVVGFVGLGAMGSEMVRRLLAAGRKIAGYNRTRSKAQPLLDAGMGWWDSPRGVAEAATVIFTMVADTAALHAVTEGPDGILAGLGPGKIYIDTSTVTVREGRLSFMVGGEKAACDAVTPILLDIGARVTYVGGHGQGALMKIATNLNLGAQMLAFSEGMLLAEKGGIPRELAAEVLLNSAIASPMLRYRGPFVLRDPEEVLFTVNMMQKDMLLALEMGRELDVPLPTTAVANEFLTAARAIGLEDKDFAAMYEALARLSGRPR